MPKNEAESNGTMMAGRLAGEPIVSSKVKRATKKKDEVVVIKNLKTEKINVRIESVEGSPLVIQKFSEKNRGKIELKQAGAGRQERAKRDPEDDYLQAIHIDSDGHVAYPAVAFKKGMVRACDSTQDMKMTRARGAFFVLGDNVKILHKGKPIKAPTKKGQSVPGIKMRTDTVRLPNKSADMRYRPEVAEWSAQLTIIYNTAVCSAEQIVNLLNTSGFSCGIGENRPEKSGNSWGMYRVCQ